MGRYGETSRHLIHRDLMGLIWTSESLRTDFSLATELGFSKARILLSINILHLSLMVYLDIDIGPWNSELAFETTNAAVWMSLKIGIGITVQHQAVLEQLPHPLS